MIEHLVRCGDEFAFGLEAGSKPELLIAMASLRNKESPLICNGYKDREFIDLGLNAVRLGFRCFFVIENLHELDLILERSKTLGIEPLLGARIKLSTKVEGNWQNDSGDRSLFGLTTIQLITLVDKLKHVNKLHFAGNVAFSSWKPNSQYSKHSRWRQRSLSVLYRYDKGRCQPEVS